MAEKSEDTQQRSEKPTPRRLEQARKKGQIPQTRDLYHCFVFLTFLIFFIFYGSAWMGQLFTALSAWMGHVDKIPLDAAGVRFVFEHMSHLFAGTVGLFFGTLALMMLGGGILQQRGLRFRLKNITPALERISVLKGLVQLVSPVRFIEFFKALLKLVVVLGVVVYVGFQALPGLIPLSGSASWSVMTTLRGMTTDLVWAGLWLAVVLAALDYGYQWFTWMKRMLMSRRDIQDEQKETDRNPKVLQRQRRVRQELARMRVVKMKVPEATVLVTNPSHYAVALSWVPHRMMAPEVIAKGKDRTALYMKRLAKQHHVPTVENPSLARSLFAAVKEGEAVHPKHYEAVASVIRYVMQVAEHRRHAD